jgi:peptide chain release factor 2
VRDAKELFEIAREESDDATLTSVHDDAAMLERSVADLEFRRMFGNPADPNNCFVDIQAGSGGTEAQDSRSRYSKSRRATSRALKVPLLK